MVAGTKANEEPRNTGIWPLVKNWNINVPNPAVNKATLGSMPVKRGTMTVAPKAMKSVCAPSKQSDNLKE